MGNASVDNVAEPSSKIQRVHTLAGHLNEHPTACHFDLDWCGNCSSEDDDRNPSPLHKSVHAALGAPYQNLFLGDSSSCGDQSLGSDCNNDNTAHSHVLLSASGSPPMDTVSKLFSASLHIVVIILKLLNCYDNMHSICTKWALP